LRGAVSRFLPHTLLLSFRVRLSDILILCIQPLFIIDYRLICGGLRAAARVKAAKSRPMKEAFDFAAFGGALTLSLTAWPRPNPMCSNIPRERKAINASLIGSLLRPFIYAALPTLIAIFGISKCVTINFYSFLPAGIIIDSPSRKCSRARWEIRAPVLIGWKLLCRKFSLRALFCM
jgi:hypothetical protein